MDRVPLVQVLLALLDLDVAVPAGVLLAITGGGLRLGRLLLAELLGRARKLLGSLLVLLELLDLLGNLLGLLLVLLLLLDEAGGLLGDDVLLGLLELLLLLGVLGLSLADGLARDLLATVRVDGVPLVQVLFALLDLDVALPAGVLLAGRLGGLLGDLLGLVLHIIILILGLGILGLGFGVLSLSIVVEVFVVLFVVVVGEDILQLVLLIDIGVLVTGHQLLINILTHLLF